MFEMISVMNDFYISLSQLEFSWLHSGFMAIVKCCFIKYPKHFIAVSFLCHLQFLHFSNPSKEILAQFNIGKFSVFVFFFVGYLYFLT